jgi:hypothetical protein
VSDVVREPGAQGIAALAGSLLARADALRRDASPALLLARELRLLSRLASEW